MTIKKRRSIPSSNPPVVMVSSYPPRLCGIGTFIEEARELIQRANPKREVIIVSHTDGQGEDNHAYELAREAKRTGYPAALEPEF
jgi:hypothetical protein